MPAGPARADRARRVCAHPRTSDTLSATRCRAWGGVEARRCLATRIGIVSGMVMRVNVAAFAVAMLCGTYACAQDASTSPTSLDRVRAALGNAPPRTLR